SFTCCSTQRLNTETYTLSLHDALPISGTWKVNTSDQECSASQTIKTYFSLLYKKDQFHNWIVHSIFGHEIGLVKGFKINICEVLLWKGEFLRDTDILYYFIYYLR